jgi:hypothetical protein
VAAIVSNKAASLGNMIRETASGLHETLVNISESFLNHGLRFLFLLNNSYFIRQELSYGTYYFSPQQNLAALFGKVEGYMESYLQVSWAPVLSCLLNPTPLCFGRKYSLLPKFEFEFQKTYTTQKLWKVPDPELKKTLRKAIIEKITRLYKLHRGQQNYHPKIQSPGAERDVGRVVRGMINTDSVTKKPSHHRVFICVDLFMTLFLKLYAKHMNT